jgi:hypothetical protein
MRRRRVVALPPGDLLEDYHETHVENRENGV